MYYNIEAIQSQDIMPDIAERMAYKEALIPYITKLYKNQCAENVLLKNRCANLIDNYKDCAKVIYMDGGTMVGTEYCKQRICPVCNMRKSRMTWHKVNDIVNALPKMVYVLITLTVKNCAVCDLSRTLDNLHIAFKRLVNRKTWQNSFVGYFRGTEVTYNAKDDTFHPHIHILAVAEDSYYVNDFVDNQTLRTWWTESANLDYYVQTDIRAVKDLGGGIAEVAKYAVKMSTILENQVNAQRLRACQYLLSALYNRRLCGTGGIITKTAKALKIDINADDVPHISANSKPYIYDNGIYKPLDC